MWWKLQEFMHKGKGLRENIWYHYCELWKEQIDLRPFGTQKYYLFLYENLFLCMCLELSRFHSELLVKIRPNLHNFKHDNLL